MLIFCIKYTVIILKIDQQLLILKNRNIHKELKYSKIVREPITKSLLIYSKLKTFINKYNLNFFVIFAQALNYTISAYYFNL